MKPYLWHPKLVIKLIVMPCDKRKPGNTKIRVQIARNVSKNGVKTKRAALLHRDIRVFFRLYNNINCQMPNSAFYLPPNGYPVNQ